jgi:hypothetical protein
MNDLCRVRQVITHPYTLLTSAALFWAGNVVLGRDVAGRIPPKGRKDVPTSWQALMVTMASPSIRNKRPGSDCTAAAASGKRRVKS